MINIKLLIKKTVLFTSIFFCLIVGLSIFNINKVNNEVFTFNPKINKIFVGSSTSQCALNDTILLNCVNMSSSADPVFYSYLKIKKIIEHNPSIDTIFIAISPSSFTDNIDDKWLFNESHFAERIGNYYFLMDSEDLRILKEHLGNNFYKIGFGNIAIRSIRNFREYCIGDLRDIYGGYMPNHRSTLTEEINNIKKDTLNIESKIEIEYLNKTIQECKKNQIELIFITPPIRKEYVRENLKDFVKFNEFYKNRYSQITYIDLSLFPLLESDYADLHHLNYSGSIKFSQYLQDIGIKNLIAESNKQKYDFRSIDFK